MSARLGIALSARELRAVFVNKGAVAWKSSAEVRGVDSIGSAVEALFADAPKTVLRAGIGICVGPPWAQVKPLHGLPPLKSAHLATQLVRENHQAFFLSRGGPVAIVDVCIPGEGLAWGAAFDRDGVEELTRALREKRLSVFRIAPTVAAIAAIQPGRIVEWVDAGVAYTIEGDASGLRRLERFAAGSAKADGDAARYADARAAAMAPRNLPLSWFPPPDAARTRVLAFARNVSTSLALGAAAGFAAFGPGLRARAFTQSAESGLAYLRPAQKELAESDAELRRVTQMLDRVQTFRAERGDMSRMLGQLSQSVPESTAMMTFHVDSAEGSFTAIAPHIADVLPELASVSEIESPKIVGSVTREVIGGVHVERATFRFRRPRKAVAATARKAK